MVLWKRLTALVGLVLVGWAGACAAPGTEPADAEPADIGSAVTVTRTVESSATPLPTFSPEQDDVVDSIRDVYFDQVCSSLRGGTDVRDSVASASRGVTMFTLTEHVKLHAAAIERDCPEFLHLAAELDR